MGCPGGIRHSEFLGPNERVASLAQDAKLTPETRRAAEKPCCLLARKPQGPLGRSVGILIVLSSLGLTMLWAGPKPTQIATLRGCRKTPGSAAIHRRLLLGRSRLRYEGKDWKASKAAMHRRTPRHRPLTTFQSRPCDRLSGQSRGGHGGQLSGFGENY